MTSKAKRNSPPQDYSVNALSKLLGHDRRTIDKALVGIRPVRMDGKTKFYKLEDVEEALKARPGQTLREQKLFEEVKNWRIRNQKLLDQLLEESKESAWLYQIAKETSSVLWQKLVNEMPSAVAGFDEPAARIYAKRIYNAVMQGWRQIVKKQETRSLLVSEEQKQQ